ncbi:TolC family protein [Chitinophaga vietnamensis]|uniref:TolC family protein n=1 Tax=Chitinophaga vietnamensis TaxID=2593957 RepID=UPI001177E3AC|nr:TolC family protein [Chitinophaga vietnamensis]
MLISKRMMSGGNLLSVGCLIMIMLLPVKRATAQDLKQQDLTLTLSQAESMFLQKNLLLLAQKYNVDAAKALILQARLWPNPNFNIAQGAYNTNTKKWFETDSANGETAIQLQQQILLARKINKQVKIAKTNYELAQYNLFDLLRTLKYVLRSDFFNIYYLQQSLKVYDEEINGLMRVDTAFLQQKSKGYIAETEVIRIRAQLYSLQSEKNDLVNQIEDKQSEMRVMLLLPPTAHIVPTLDSETVIRQNPMGYPLATLLDSARQNRTDLMIARTTLTLSEQQYAYQKALAVPDLTLGLAYDKNGSYIHNFNSVGVGFNIPIFNRNQGNIRAAKATIENSKTLLENTEKTLDEQIFRAMQKAIASDKLYTGMDASFQKDFSRLSKAVYENYVKRNVQLIDFLNFYDSYKQNIVQLNYISFNKVNALENLNFLTGTNFYNK